MNSLREVLAEWCTENLVAEDPEPRPSRLDLLDLMASADHRRRHPEA